MLRRKETCAKVIYKKVWKMRGMKKKGSGSEGEEVKKGNIKKSLSVVMAAVLVSSVMIAFAPLAAADIASFTIAPDKGETGAVSAYDVTINTTGFTLLDMTIPAGFKAEVPEDGDLLAETWTWDNESNEYYIKFTANGTDEIDLYCACGSDEVNYTFDASYGEGDSINISVRCWGTAYANLTLPTSTVNGSLNMSLGGSSKKLTNVSISIKEFVRNPAECGNYTFNVIIDNTYFDSDTVWITAAVQSINITSPVNRTYASTCVRLNFTVESDCVVALAWVGYSLDGAANVTIEGNTTVPVGAPPYGHNIVVYATDIHGNTVASDTVFFTIHPGDINFDDKVWVWDVWLMRGAYGSKPGDGNWNEDADLDCNDHIWAGDVFILRSNYNNKY